MEFKELLEARRSIRAYSENVTITEDEIKSIIYAAQQAPSWKNSQTGRYYAAISPEMIARIRSECLPEYNSNNSKNAAALIVTAYAANRSGFERDGSPTNERGNEWGAYDLGLQNQNLLLAAKELGFDSLVMGLRNADKLHEMLGIPEDQHIMSVISLGKRAAEPQKPERKNLEDIVKMF
ncbi:MAG: nitroreductase family protein [Oscillospiraceae bacterium]